ncbi:hypothetical protein [Endozoicomonas numazuensis]|uniref:Ubiquitin-like protease family profile domain-containing protein n=1 Tax=Endozoicomonas numazuensis TaxID=1137799 RepID=A0A081NCL4_9GAMM|nr:hypothetical protein [Endozoicomonas numazuensis]KEQ16187.1 hypothetical protein GZ78_23410 [Endozoicomonas numazuensis]
MYTTGLNVVFPVKPPDPSKSGEETISDRLKIRRKDPVCQQVVMRHGYEVNSCRKCLSIALRDDVRKISMTPYVSKTLNSESEQRSWKIARFRSFEDDLTDLRDCQDIIEGIRVFRDLKMPYEEIGKAFYCQKGGSLKLEPLTDDIAVMDVFLCDPDPKKTFDTIQIKLPSLRSIPEGKEIMVFYDRDAPVLDDDEPEDNDDFPGPAAKKARLRAKQLLAPNVSLNPIARERGASKTLNNLILSPQECAVYVKRNGQWHVRHKMVKCGESINPNPLLRLSGPLVVSKNDELLKVPDDGEFFLNQTIMKTLYEKKFKEHQQQYSDDSLFQPIPWDYVLSDNTTKKISALDQKAQTRAVLQAGQAEMGNDDSDESAFSTHTDYTYHFFFERWNSCHVIAVFCHVTDSEVFLYLHETEGTGNTTSKRIRAQVSAMMQKLHSDKALIIYYPNVVFQKDFASCGVFAMKAMNYFRKHPQEMVQWLLALHQSDTKGSEEKMEQGVATFAEPETAGGSVAFQGMPAGLLKMFHGRLFPTGPKEPVLSDEQLNTPVNKSGETLREYLWKYEAPEVEKPGGGTTIVNVGTTAKRLEYFAKYEHIMEESHGCMMEESHGCMRLARKRGVDVVDVVDEKKDYMANSIQDADLSRVPPAAKRMKKSVGKDDDAPAWVLNLESLEAINEWLAGQGGEAFSEDEWGYVGEYFRFAANDRNLDLFGKKYPAANEWFLGAIKKPLTNAKWVLVNHWFNGGITGEPTEFKKELHERSDNKTSQ